MNTQKALQNRLEDIRVQMKLAALWASFMFLYIYVDYFGLYKPDYISNILAGKVFIFDITQAFLLTGLVLTTGQSEVSVEKLGSYRRLFLGFRRIEFGCE